MRQVWQKIISIPKPFAIPTIPTIPKRVYMVYRNRRKDDKKVCQGVPGMATGSIKPKMTLFEVCQGCGNGMAKVRQKL